MVKTFSLPSIQWLQNQVVLQRALVNVFAPADYDLLQIAHPRTANRCINEVSEKENSFGHYSSVTTWKKLFSVMLCLEEIIYMLHPRKRAIATNTWICWNTGTLLWAEGIQHELYWNISYIKMIHTQKSYKSGKKIATKTGSFLAVNIHY